MNNDQKSSIEVSSQGVKFEGNQSDYLGTIIWGGVGLALILAIALVKWGPALLGKFKKNGKDGNGKNGGSLNGKARIEDISKGLIALTVKVDDIKSAVDDNALKLESYKIEVEREFSKKDSIDVEQREKIKALERTVYKQ